VGWGKKGVGEAISTSGVGSTGPGVLGRPLTISGSEKTSPGSGVFSGVLSKESVGVFFTSGRCSGCAQAGRAKAKHRHRSSVSGVSRRRVEVNTVGELSSYQQENGPLAVGEIHLAGLVFAK
jgi:hypothetical protein